MNKSAIFYWIEKNNRILKIDKLKPNLQLLKMSKLIMIIKKIFRPWVIDLFIYIIGKYKIFKKV